MKTLGFYLRYAAVTLWRGGQRTAFAIFCVAVGVLAIVALQLVGAMVATSLSGSPRALNGGDVAVHAEGSDLGQRQLGYFDDLKAAGTITAYSPVAEEGATTVDAQGVARIVVDGVDPATFPLAGTPHVVAPTGASLGPLLRDGAAVATTTVANQLGLHVGDTLTFTTDGGRKATVRIGGIVANDSVLNQGNLMLSLAAYEAIPNPAGGDPVYTWVYVDVPGHSDAEAAALARRVVQHLPLLTATTAKQAFAANAATVQNIRYFLDVIALLALLIGGVGIFNTMQMQLRRRLVEIAMLKTQGYRRRDLIGMFGVEALLLGLLGGAVGAAAGIAASLGVAALVERGFFLSLTPTVDPSIVASGVAVGCYAAVVFALLPIARASGVRPLGILRETPERGGITRIVASAGLFALLGVFFFALAVSILGNVVIALAVVLGAGMLLFVLSLLFAVLAWLISHVPLGWVVPLPRRWRADGGMALRNIGRHKARSAATMLALSIGVFAIGLGLVLGQGVKGRLAHLADTHLHYNTYVLARQADKSRVDSALAGVLGVSQRQVSVAATASIASVNDVPLAQILPPSASQVADSRTSPGVVALQGFDLGAGSLPDVTLSRGLQDGGRGRLLSSGDASTGNALLPVAESEAPLKLKLGDRLTITAVAAGGAGAASESVLPAASTITVVGFYTGATSLGVSPVLLDQDIALGVDGGAPVYLYALKLDPPASQGTLAAIRSAAPDAVMVSVGDTLQSVGTALDNIVQVIEAVASLALIAGVLMIANAVALAMLERRREIGILKAIGHTGRDVLAMVIAENAILAAMGAIVALAIVGLAAAVLGQAVFGAPFGMPMPLALGLTVATTVGAGIVASAVVWTAIRVRPLDVLRYE